MARRGLRDPVNRVAITIGKGRQVKISTAIGTVAALALLAACGEREVILQGERIDPRVQAMGESLQATAAQPVPIRLPAARANAEWDHRAGNPAHAPGHVALSPAPVQVWEVPIGAGNDRKHRINAQPIVAGNRVFTLDSQARVTATDLSGRVLWQADLTPPSDRPGEATGGGLAFGSGRVFATTGYGELIALDPANGGILWRQRLQAGVGGAPTVSDGLVYVVADDASAWAVRAADGKVEWTLPGTPSPSGVAGAAAPAVDARQVVLPFDSGQMISVDRRNGTGLWQAFVAGKRRGRAYASVSDLTGDPVIADGTVYAGTHAGRLIAVDADTGARLWTAPDGALSPVAVAGGSVFLVNDEDQLLRLDAASGAEIWRVDLPYFTKDKDKRRKAVVAHYGPVLAGGRLVVVSSDGLLRSFDPQSGALVYTAPLPGGAAAAPAVAGGVLYVVTRDGRLRAFR